MLCIFRVLDIIWCVVTCERSDPTWRAVVPLAEFAMIEFHTSSICFPSKHIRYRGMLEFRIRTIVVEFIVIVGNGDIRFQITVQPLIKRDLDPFEYLFRRIDKSVLPFTEWINLFPFRCMIFYDRRELFCPRILSFCSGSRWCEAHFIGKPKKGLPEKRRTRISWDLPQAKPKMETQGKHFDLFQLTLCYIG